MPEIDLEAYFRRINYTGPATPTLATLQAILLHHTQAIAFENLNPFLQRPVNLDPASLQQKLVREGRGGYCFEQNGLLNHVLRKLGFQVTTLVARVLWNMPEETITPRSHMVLRIDITGQSYIADVGFGGMTPTSAIRLQPDLEQATPHGSFRLVRSNELFRLQTKIRDEWKTLYRFGLQEQFQPDYEVANWYTSTNPNSHFTSNLIAARPAPGCRYALRNTELSIHHTDGASEQRQLSTVSELKAALVDIFGLSLPAGPELDQAMQGIIARSTTGGGSLDRQTPHRRAA
jgi:N-hydroxyarylamine O-acetyltransferase